MTRIITDQGLALPTEIYFQTLDADARLLESDHYLASARF
jgi:hypothetical protein